jgi:hypothetical protein
VYSDGSVIGIAVRNAPACIYTNRYVLSQEYLGVVAIFKVCLYEGVVSFWVGPIMARTILFPTIDDVVK